MSNIEKFFFDYEEIKSGFTKDNNLPIKISRYSSNFIRGKNFSGSNSVNSKEAVVKLISNLNKNSTASCIKYISHHNDGNLKDSFGNKTDIKKTLDDWDLSLDKNSKDVWHLMFSIKEEKNERNFKILEKSVLEIMHLNFPNNDFVYSIHSHQQNPHIHVLMKKRNNLTKKKIHFENKSDIATLFKKIRNDFSISLNFEGLDYRASSKLENLDNLVIKYNNDLGSLKNNPLNEINDIFMRQLKKIHFEKEKNEKLINDLSIDRKKEREKIFQIKIKNKEYWISIRKIKELNKGIGQAFRKIKELNKQEMDIKSNYIDLEKRIGLLSDKNLNILENIAFIEKKYNRKYLSKKEFRRISFIKQSFKVRQDKLNDTNSKLSKVLKKNLNIKEIIEMIEIQKVFKNKTIEALLIKELDIKKSNYSKELKNPNIKEKRLGFIKKELDLLEKTIKKDNSKNNSRGRGR